jgi:hypothetical protein
VKNPANFFPQDLAPSIQSLGLEHARSIVTAGAIVLLPKGVSCYYAMAPPRHVEEGSMKGVAT